MAGEWQTVHFSELLSEPLRNGLTRPKRVRGVGYKMVNMGELFAHHDRVYWLSVDMPVAQSALESLVQTLGAQH